MARLFDDASSEYLTGTSPVANGPFSMAAWFQSDEATNTQELIAMDAGSGNQEQLRISGGNIQLSSYDGTEGVASTSTTYSVDTWHHACGVWSSSTSRAAFLDGGGKGTNATDVSPAGLSSVNIGIRTGPTGPMSGMIAEAAMWNVALSDAEVAQLALGYCPLMIRPDALVAYWPLGGIYGVNAGNAANGDLDLVGGYHMDPQNTPTTAEHPSTLLYPRSGLFVTGTAAAPPAGNRRRRFFMGAA